MRMRELARRVIRDFREYQTPIQSGPVIVLLVDGGFQVLVPEARIPSGFALVVKAGENGGCYAVQPASGWRAFMLRIRYPRTE